MLAMSVGGCIFTAILPLTFYSTLVSAAAERHPASTARAIGHEADLTFATSLLQRHASKSVASAPHASETLTGGVDYDHPSWLESCKSIYLDVGSNIGVQVRKLFEPGLYPNASVLPLFTQQFGPPERRCIPATDSGLCALGFEPNPLWHSRLMSLRMAYEDKGWHVHFYPFAVGYDDSKVQFTVKKHGRNMDWGAKVAALRENDDSAIVNVTATSIDFGRFVKSLPMHKIRLMKMDIEGSEWNAMASMAAHGVLCADWIEEAFIEVHNKGSTAHWHDKRSYDAMHALLQNQTCPGRGQTKLLEIDDESYNLDQSVLPWTASACDAQSIGQQ